MAIASTSNRKRRASRALRQCVVAAGSWTGAVPSVSQFTTAWALPLQDLTIAAGNRSAGGQIMPIRARVWKTHTGRRTTLPELGRRPEHRYRPAEPDSTASGGAGGSLRPRVIAGIASNELYAAIVAFETKHFPAQRLGFFDPGGRMFRKLEVLGTLAPAPGVRATAPHLHHRRADDRPIFLAS